jgi:subtilase family serine protease
VKSPGDVLLSAKRTVPSLVPGVTSTGSATVTVPALTSGSYVLLACADDTNTAVESSEANNCVASSAMLTVP